MRSGLFWKLFLLQMLAGAMLLGGALAVTRMYSVRNFGEFIEQRDRVQMRDLAAELAKAYGQTGDLAQAAQTIPPLWRRLHRRELACDGPDCGPQTARFTYRWPPPESGTAPAGEPAPPDELPPPPEDAEAGPPRVLHFRSRGGIAGVRVAIGGPMPPLQLLDARGIRLLGGDEPIGADAVREAVMVDGEVVGHLVRPPMRAPPEQREFARREARRLMTVAPIALLIAGLFALAITALIVRPIRQLSGGAAALARREFSTRLPEHRRDELGQLAADFNRLAAALEGYDGRQRQWLADIAHELRTPLAVLRGELEAVMEGVRTIGPGLVESLRQEVGRLETLVQDLHLVSLAESGGLRPHLSTADVGALAEAAVRRFAPRFQARGFETKVEIQPDLSALVDVQRFEQVLGNLLGNALAHAAPPGPVAVTARADGAHIVVSVADAGPGVPADALPRLFDRLFRVESARTRTVGGAGLGLSICKSIVEAHGGTIAAQRSAAGGLEIVIKLPLPQ